MQDLRIGRFEESITLLQSLGRLSIDLKMDHSAGNVSNNRAWVEMSTGPLRWGKFNLFDLYMLDRLSTSDDSREKRLSDYGLRCRHVGNSLITLGMVLIAS